MGEVAAVPTIKGSVIREFVRAYEQRQGAAELSAIVARLPPELAAELDPRRPGLGLLPSHSYPCALAHALLEEICAGRSPAQRRSFARETADAAIRSLGHGVYRLLAGSLVSPAMLVRAMPRIWTLVHNTGARRARLLGPGAAESVIEGWAGHQALLCEVMSEATGALFRGIGCKDVTVERTTCVDLGGTGCTTVVRWSP